MKIKISLTLTTQPLILPYDHLPGAASYKQKSLPTTCSTRTMQEVTSQSDLYGRMLHYWPTANEPHLPDTSRT